MSLAVIRKITQDLIDIDYHGTVGLTGFSEPFLYEHLVEAVSILSTTSATVDINTNGDFITSHLVKNLEDAGLNTLYISMYDDDKTEYYQELLRDINLNIIYRHHYDHSTNYNLNIVNRSYILKESTPLDILRPCHIPFYKTVIDYNGNYLLCSEDWGRASAKDNVLNISIKDQWLHGYTKHRQALVQGRRELVEPCNKCNVNGTLAGQDSFARWQVL
jgi:MoaA/NifB/PqqE/SkfB family radical SAM enzyme